MGTRALMERDRVNHKLQLSSLDALPREIAKEILQETCRELQLNDVSLIGPSIRKMVQVMLMVPRLEAVRPRRDIFRLQAGGIIGQRRPAIAAPHDGRGPARARPLAAGARSGEAK